MVNKEISIIKPQTLINIKLNRINRKIPAVTKVEECTKEDTGVGAAIAAGSHAENGIWALLVIEPTITITENHRKSITLK